LVSTTISVSFFSKFQISTGLSSANVFILIINKILKLKNISYLTILKFSFGIIFSISFLGAGKSNEFIKNTIPITTINPSVDLITIPVILALPELVFLVNCI
jgi:hypothetical protein